MATLTAHGFRRGRLWIMAILAVVLVAVHASAVYYVSSHIALSAGVLAGIVVLIVLKHLGLIAPAFALLRRHRRNR